MRRRNKIMAGNNGKPLTDAEHSPLGPSVMHRRELCPGSYEAEKAIPEQESGPDAAVGKALHAVTADIILGNAVDAIKAGENAFAVEACLGVASKIQDDYRCFDNVLTFVEERVDLNAIHEGIDFGTADYGVAIPFDRGAVVDWKFGHGEVPPARENRQVWAYACGWRRKFELEQVTGMVACPMTGRYSEHTWTAAELDIIEKRLRSVADACLVPWALRLPSPKACEYCRAVTVCPAVTIEIEEFRKAAQGRMPAELTPSEIDKLLGLSELLGKWSKAAQGQAYKVLQAGGSIPNWGLRPGRALRHWKESVDKDLLREVGEKLGKPVDALVEEKLVTVAQLEKQWGQSKAVKEALKELNEKRPGELKLARMEEGTETEE